MGEELQSKGKLPPELKDRRQQMRSAGWRQGGLYADKVIRERPDLTAADAKAAGLDFIASTEPVLRQVGATDAELEIWAEAFGRAFLGKIERHFARRAERERKRALWCDRRSLSA
jgi:hypothetical protein